MSYRNQYKSPLFKPTLSGTPEQRIQQLYDALTFHFQKDATLKEREFQAIQQSTKASISNVLTISSGGGSSGGGSSSFVGTAIMVTQPVTAGTVTVNFPALASTNYGVHGFVLLNGSTDIGIAKPRIPPDSDTRGLTSCQIIVYDSGLLYAFIVLAA